MNTKELIVSELESTSEDLLSEVLQFVKSIKRQQPVSIIATQIKENQIKIMQIELSHIYTLDLLPLHHRDPFDRIIIAQAMNEKVSIASIDKAFY